MDIITIRNIYTGLSKLLGRTPLHPQFFSKSFLNKQVHRNAGCIQGIVADLGCGLKPYRNYFENSKYIGLDFPSTSVARLSNEADIYGDLAQLPFCDNCLDGVLCTQVLEHVQDPMKAILEIKRVLKPDGILLLSVPFFYPLHDEPHDYFRFSKNGLRTMLSRAELEVLEITPQGGFFPLAGELLNLYFIHKLSKLYTSGTLKLTLGIILTLPFLIFSVINNLSCLTLSILDQERRFTMNYFIVAKG
jgi:SAM-dependent methyltransferase